MSKHLIFFTHIIHGEITIEAETEDKAYDEAEVRLEELRSLGSLEELARNDPTIVFTDDEVEL